MNEGYIKRKRNIQLFAFQFNSMIKFCCPLMNLSKQTILEMTKKF